MLRTFILLFCLFGYTQLIAQKSSIKFGKIDESFVKMSFHPLDTSAYAVILRDNGRTNFLYENSRNRFTYTFERTVLIKVQTKDGLIYGDFKIPFYDSDSGDERVFRIKGYSYNFVNGKVIKSKLEKESIFREKTSDNWSQVKISMPDVKVGTVVELTYSISSPYTWNLQTWRFQSNIPTVRSEYSAIIPEYFDYQLLSSGYHPYAVSEKKFGNGSVSYASTGSSGNGNFDSSGGSTQSLNFRTTKYHWVVNNVPAFVLEPYVASSSDYITKMEFELKGTHFPGSAYRPVMGSWDKLNTTYLENTSFGAALNQTGYMNDELKLIKTAESDEAKIAMLVKIIKNQVDWNDYYTKYIDNTLRRAWVDRTGGTADINLMLVAGLRDLGFTADPVLISTRGHGLVRDYVPVTSQFNSVVALVELGGKMILLDATDKYIPVNALPKKCLNGKGWRVSASAPGWVDLNPSANSERQFEGSFSIDEIGFVKGNITTAAMGYRGYSSYKKYKIKGEEDFIEEIRNTNPTWEIEEFEIDDSAGLAGPFKINYELELNENLLASGNRIYFNPTMGEMMSENPFKLEEREYPVDFAHPLAESYIFTFTIPDGYSVEELPESSSIALPGKAALFNYNVKAQGNKVTVSATYKINKPMFNQPEYPALKQFYDQMVEKCAEQVVLNRKT